MWRRAYDFLLEELGEKSGNDDHGKDSSAKDPLVPWFCASLVLEEERAFVGKNGPLCRGHGEEPSAKGATTSTLAVLAPVPEDEKKAADDLARYEEETGGGKAKKPAKAAKYQVSRPDSLESGRLMQLVRMHMCMHVHAL